MKATISGAGHKVEIDFGEWDDIDRYSDTRDFFRNKLSKLFSEMLLCEEYRLTIMFDDETVKPTKPQEFFLTDNEDGTIEVRGTGADGLSVAGKIVCESPHPCLDINVDGNTINVSMNEPGPDKAVLVPYTFVPDNPSFQRISGTFTVVMSPSEPANITITAANAMPIEAEVNTSEELENVLRDVSFRNTVLDFKWRFEWQPIRITSSHDPFDREGWLVWCTFERPDTESGKVSRGRGRDEIVWKGTTVSGVVKTCWLLVELLIKHELMEGFRWHNARIFNPHHSVFDLAQVQHMHTKKPPSQARHAAMMDLTLRVIDLFADSKDTVKANLRAQALEALRQ